ncbi:MAG TPA: hypothetical protein VN238_04945 [Solirubrobacteraceae bacterium]|nr:hypothetical protein [Solirubrobacteraceae bacterium]
MPTYTPHSPECVVFGLLLDCYPAPLSVDELVQEAGQHVDAVNAVQNLEGAGLVRRTGDLVLPTRPAWLCAVLLGDVSPNG